VAGQEEIPMRASLIVIVIVGVVAAGLYLYRDQIFPSADKQSMVEGASPESTPGEAADPGIEQEAEQYIATLTEPDLDPVAVEKADHFITKDQTISLLPEGTAVETTREELAADPSLSPDTPITVVKEVEQIEMTTPERIIAEAGGDLEKKIKILQDGKVKEATTGEVLEEYRKKPQQDIAVIKNVEYFEVTTPKEVANDPSIEAGATLKIIRKPYSLEAATVADLLREQEELSPDSVFYVRTVREGDDQGIWGIVHHGIIDNFARGMAIRRGEEINTYQVEIPRNADERLDDRSSSFLGHLIQDKTVRSYVWNFKKNRMGKNPDSVNPGQEIVIINFEPDELIDIYKHFASEQG
jgi:hypothetical protein